MVLERKLKALDFENANQDLGTRVVPKAWKTHGGGEGVYTFRYKDEESENTLLMKIVAFGGETGQIGVNTVNEQDNTKLASVEIGGIDLNSQDTTLNDVVKIISLKIDDKYFENVGIKSKNQENSKSTIKVGGFNLRPVILDQPNRPQRTGQFPPDPGYGYRDPYEVGRNDMEPFIPNSGDLGSLMGPNHPLFRGVGRRGGSGVGRIRYDNPYGGPPGMGGFGGSYFMG